MDVLGQRSAPGSLTTTAIAVARGIAHAREVRGLGRVHGINCARPRDPEPEIAKPAKRRALISGEKPKEIHVAVKSSLIRRFFASLVLPRARCARCMPLPGGLRCNPGGSFVLNRRP